MKFKQKANIILTVCFLLFIVCIILSHQHPHQPIFELLTFIAEAALVGGIADWFAVRALFIRPMGIPWHTALIPRNRRKVIQSVSIMVKDELLETKIIKEHLHKINIVRTLINWVDCQQNGRRNIGTLTIEIVKTFIKQMDTKKLSVRLEALLKDKVKKINLASISRNFLERSARNDDIDRIIDFFIKELTSLCKKNTTRDKIYLIINKVVKDNVETGNWLSRNVKKWFFKLGTNTNTVNLNDAAESAHQELVNLLIDLGDRSHPLRQQITEMVNDLIVNLEESEDWKQAIEVWKFGLIDRINLSEAIEQLLVSTIKLIEESDTNERFEFLDRASEILEIESVHLADKKSFVLSWINKQVEHYWQQFKNDENMINSVDTSLKKGLLHLIESNKYIIGEIVTESLDKLDQDSLNKFIYDKVADDLEGIRNNGSFVGAIIGLLIFVISNYIYLPLIHIFY